MRQGRYICVILAAFMMLSGFVVNVSAQPKIKGPLYMADRLMSTNRISQGGRMESIRAAAAGLTPLAEIPSFAVPEGAGPRAVSIDYDYLCDMISGGRSIEALPLLFAEGLYPSSDTLAFLRGCASLSVRQVEMAESYMAAVPESSPYASYAARILDGIRQMDSESGRHHSPALAAAMSAIIPGSGKIYAGNLREGVSALITVGALAGMTAECISKKGAGDWCSISLAAVSGLFYAANIYGSYLSVSATETLIDNARKTAVLFTVSMPIPQYLGR